MEKQLFEHVQNNFLNKEANLSKYATKSSDAIRVNEEIDDIRPPFFHDIDRIIYGLSYTRYINKTQVFSFKNNDHISKRIIHVQLVSKIARTISRALNLNEDLTEAIALGHDIGHTPLGHPGEFLLNKISMEELNEMFNHNIQSVRTYMTVEERNLTIQVLDGIMCHNGEMLSNIYEPKSKTKEEFLKEYELCYTDKNILKSVRPMTLEGCVVRISDIIAYIGRDIEDAVNLGILTYEEIPANIKEVLGTTNREIVNTVIRDIIENSIDKPYIKLSEKVYKAIFDLKKFNYKYIYSKANTKDEEIKYENGMKKIYKEYLEQLESKKITNKVLLQFINNSSKEYLENNSNKKIVIDFIAGMTDEFFLKSISK